MDMKFKCKIRVYYIDGDLDEFDTDWGYHNMDVGYRIDLDGRYVDIPWSSIKKFVVSFPDNKGEFQEKGEVT